MVFWFWARGPTHLVEKLKFLLLTGPMALLSQLTFLRISLIYLPDIAAADNPALTHFQYPVYQLFSLLLFSL